MLKLKYLKSTFGEQYINPLAKQRAANAKMVVNPNFQGIVLDETGEAHSSNPTGKSRRPKEAAARPQAPLDAESAKSRKYQAGLRQCQGVADPVRSEYKA